MQRVDQLGEVRGEAGGGPEARLLREDLFGGDRAAHDDMDQVWLDP
ncbi:MAG TPA: hypothetical protein VK420_20345 [Longimicrobium sp.]|nr:hypothetical protein [Longimicrobium sp.]